MSPSLTMAAALSLWVPSPYQVILLSDWTTGRALDRGNPSPGNIGSDFGRLGMRLWDDVYVMHARNRARRKLLEEMLDWRNAIGHQDFGKPSLNGRTEIGLAQVRRYRRGCGALARAFDRAALAYVRSVAGPGAGW